MLKFTLVIHWHVPAQMKAVSLSTQLKGHATPMEITWTFEVDGV